MTVASKSTPIKSEVATLLRFGLVGAVTMAIYLAVFATLQRFANEYVALTIAYILAITFHYLSNRLFTFRSGKDRTAAPHLRSLTRYALVVALSYVVNLATYYAVANTFEWPEQVGLVAGVLASTAVTFLLSRLWVFESQ